MYLSLSLSLSLYLYIYKDNWRNYDSFRTMVAKNIADLFYIATMILD